MNKKIFFSGSMALLAFILILSFSCANAAQGKEELVIGGIYPLSGPAAPWGIQWSGGLEDAANDVNQAGGLKVGDKIFRIKVITKDDGYQGPKAVTEVNDLIHVSKVKYIMGPIGSVPALAIRPICEANKVLLLAGAGASDQLVAPAYPYTYRMYTYDPIRAGAFYDYLLKEKPGMKNTVLINPDDATGRRHSLRAKPIIEEKGFKILIDEYYARGTTDFYPLISRINRLKPEIVDTCGTPPGELGLLLKQIREMGYKGVVMATTGTIMPAVIIKIAGKQAAQGLLESDLDYGSAVCPPKLKQYYDRVIASHGAEHWAIGRAWVYDAARVLFQTFQFVGSTDVDKVRDALDSGKVKYEGVLGPFELGGMKTFGIKHNFITPQGVSEVIGDTHVTRAWVRPIVP